MFLIALGLAMDCFAVSISNSSVSGLVKPGIPLKTAIIFTVSHMVLIGLGYWLGGLFGKMVEGMEPVVAFFLLASIGAKMIFEAYRRHPESKVFDINRLGVVLALSLATGMDALLVGLAVAVLAGSAWLIAGLTGLLVFVFTLGGLAGGSQLGLNFAKKTAMFGGAFLVIAGLWYLLSFLGPVF